MKKPGIEETDKSFVFYRQIGKEPVKISYRVGWIWIEEEEKSPTAFNPFRKVKCCQTYTPEDARNLIAAIEELLPKQESEKKGCDN